VRSIAVFAIAGILALAACSTAAATPAPTAVAPGTSVAPSAAPSAPSQEEQFLLAGMRLDLQTVCDPLREDLADKALAGVQCRPTSDVVSRATVFLFNSERDLLTTYLARLAAHDVPPRSNAGRCLAGQSSEGAYTPGDGGPTLIAQRGGCYVDASGLAHYAVTSPPYVLVEVDGSIGDTAFVERWTWLGNQDVPGGPTVWRSDGPASPEK
jgi:hypothetical protein